MQKPTIIEDVSYETEFQEEHANVLFKPNEGPQTDFLAASEREVLYGGSAGGGKSYAMLADPLRYMGHPAFSGLLLRHTTEELRELIFKSQELYPQIWSGIKWSERKCSGQHHLERDCGCHTLTEMKMSCVIRVWLLAG